MKPLALNVAQQKRLERLARETGRTPEQALTFILRDGFDYCEWQVRESIAADTEAARVGTIPNEVVMREARAMIEAARGRRRPKAA
jgi:hypothetical protein